MSARSRQRAEDRAPAAVCALLAFGCPCGFAPASVLPRWKDENPGDGCQSHEVVGAEWPTERLAAVAVEWAIAHAAHGPREERQIRAADFKSKDVELDARTHIRAMNSEAGSTAKFVINADGSIEYRGTNAGKH